MNKRKSKAWIWSLIALIIIVAVIIVIVNKSDDEETTETTYTETTAIKTDIYNTLSNSSYVSTALEENKELHATYYFEEIYYDEEQYISAGENILKYTNGEYLTAPYNCVITATSLPESGEMCTNKHYITIQSTDTLQISLQIDEDELDTIYVGQEAKIEVDVLENNEYTGYVTSIDNSASYSSSGSSFGVVVEFENDGDILLGMSAKCSIILEQAEDVVAVASEAITTQNGKSYVIVKSENGETTNIEVETGISNDAYTEIKSGINEGDIVLIEEDDEESDSQSFGGGMMQRRK